MNLERMCLGCSSSSTIATARSADQESLHFGSLHSPHDGATALYEERPTANLEAAEAAKVRAAVDYLRRHFAKLSEPSLG